MVVMPPSSVMWRVPCSVFNQTPSRVSRDGCTGRKRGNNCNRSLLFYVKNSDLYCFVPSVKTKYIILIDFCDFDNKSLYFINWFAFCVSDSIHRIQEPPNNSGNFKQFRSLLTLQ